MPGRVYTVTAQMLPDRPFVVTAWSGSFALRVLYDVLRRPGLEPKRSGLFLAEPVRAGGQLLLTGVHRGPLPRPRPHPALCWREVEAGTPLTFTYHFLDEELARAFVEAVTEDAAVEEPACRLLLASVSFAQRELPAPQQGGRLELLRVRFLTPTSFMFYGRDVLYPSPTRLALSALKNYSAATGVDTSQAAEGVAKTVEAVGTPRARRLLVDIGEGRLVPAFTGEATIAIHASRDMPILLAALKAAEVLGVGVSRTLGFGRVQVQRAEEQ